MKSFLAKNGIPIIKWGLLPDGVMFKGKVPLNYDLCVAPTPGYIIVDVDNKGSKNGYKHIPKKLQKEFDNTFNYKTKNKGGHYWFKYSGNKVLLNTTSSIGIDLRVGKSSRSAGGYVIFYPAKNGESNINEYVSKIKTSSKEMNTWIEQLFT